MRGMKVGGCGFLFCCGVIAVKIWKKQGEEAQGSEPQEFQVRRHERSMVTLFFKVKTTEEVLEIIKSFEPIGEERIPLARCFSRVLSRDLVSPEDLPGFPRSTVDGYAVRAKDSFGANESLPGLLEVVGEIGMGEIPSFAIHKGQASKISTGGMLPEGADGVVMVEYSQLLDEKTLEVSRAVSPQENVIQPDDDFKKGSLVLPKGTRLRPQDVGVLAGLGFKEVWAHKRPRVAVISTGDEVIPVDRKPRPGQVRDINTYTLSAFCFQEGAEPEVVGLCRDNFEDLRNMVEKGLNRADTVWISGGSSVGTRDLTLKVIESFDGSALLVHGISISPGKPTIIARIGTHAVFGLPGHTASAMVVADVFLAPFLKRLSGERDFSGRGHEVVAARLSRNIESASGRDDFIRVKLTRKDQEWIAEPLFGKSGLISTLVEADGLLRVDRNTEGLYQGQDVEVMVFRPSKGAAR
jgi:molybdopterin molybdotransferase